MPEHIEALLIDEVREYPAGRQRDVERGAETPRLAALLLEKYGAGMVRATSVAGLRAPLQAEVDRLAADIDPDVEANR